MLKKLNIILISAFLALSINYNIGPFLITPVLLFYLKKDFKNIYYTYIPVFIFSLIFSTSKIFMIILMLLFVIGLYLLDSLVIRKVLRKDIYNKLITSVVLFIINILLNALFLKMNFINNIVLSFISGSVYIYLSMFLTKLINSASNKTSVVYLDSLLSFLAIIGGLSKTVFGVNLGLIISTYIVMYFARTYKNIFSLLFSIGIMLIGYGIFNISEFIFIPSICGIYFVDSIYVMLPVNALLVFGIFAPGSIYDKYSCISIMASSILFEVFSIYVVKTKKQNIDVTEHIYEKIQNASTTEMLNFALFLDKFSSNFKTPKEYNARLSDGIKTIVQNHCTNCPKAKECFEKYKTNLYLIFKTILKENKEEIDYIDIYPEFLNYCNKISSIKRTSKMLEDTFKDIPLDKKTPNNILLAQMNGFSNTIKKYVLDINSKKELSYLELMMLKNALIDYGFDITYYEIQKQFEDEFLIIVGLKNISFNESKEIIKTIASNFIEKDISIVFYKEENKNIYINIIPKVKIDITYGFGSLSAEGVDICGDNYLIKELQNGKFVSAISDGMGKGYKAFVESDTTLKLINDIVSLNISTESALEILNTYYCVQDYLEEYATLDFVEINRYLKKANFYKMGASTSYIFKRNGNVEKIINKSLPFGIDEEIDQSEYTLDNGDLILMSSDGIFENIINVDDFLDFISNIKNYPPQRIVYEILNYTLTHKIQTKDDMSIIALKVQDAA